MSEAGLVGIHRRRYVEMLEKEFEERPKKVQILETWTGFRIQLQEWISGVIENGAVVEILLLDPTSEHVKYRSQALGTNVKGEIENDLVCLGRTVRELEQKNPEYKDKLQIKVYNATPVVNMYRFGDTRIVGMYLWGTDSTRGPQLRMKACNDCQKAFLIEPLDKHFNKIWQAEPIPGSGNKIVTKPVEVEEAQSGTESVEVTESKVIVEV